MEYYFFCSTRKNTFFCSKREIFPNTAKGVANRVEAINKNTLAFMTGLDNAGTNPMEMNPDGRDALESLTETDAYCSQYLDLIERGIKPGDSDLKKTNENLDKLEEPHIMCLVSENTIKSWWVPYELGFAKKAEKIITTLTLKDTVTLPEFLKIGVVIRGTKSLNKYLENLKSTNISESKNLISHTERSHPLDDYLSWNQ